MKPERAALTFLTAMAPASALELRATAKAGGAALDREQLLADVLAGKDRRLFVDLVAFRQTEASNKNYVRFTAAALQQLGRTFVGQPFLRDHDQWDLAARGGTIVASSFEGGEGLGEVRQTVELSAPWAIEAVLRGLMDRFSIGWRATSRDQPFCSVCDASMFSYDCSHFPGDVVELRGGAKKVCEAIYTDVTGKETSAVNVPAVDETEIEGIRAALAAHRGTTDKEKNVMQRFPKLSARLGVSEDADEAAHLAAVDRIGLEERTLLAAEKKRADGLETELAAVRKAGDSARIERLLAEVRRKCGQKLGEDKKPIRGGTEFEACMLTLAEVSVDRAEAWVQKLAQLAPPATVRSREPDPIGEAGAAGMLSDIEKKTAKQLGVTDEQFLATKAKMAREQRGQEGA